MANIQNLSALTEEDVKYRFITPALEQGLIDLVHPNVPNKPEQTYRLTAKGLEIYSLLTGKDWL